MEEETDLDMSEFFVFDESLIKRGKMRPLMHI